MSSKFTNIELLWVEGMDDDTFTRDIIEGEELELHRKRMLADLLFERMHYYLLADDSENSENVAWKSYRIYNEVLAKGKNYDPVVQSKIEYLRTR